MATIEGNNSPDTFTFNPGDDYDGKGGNDTLQFNTTNADLSTTTLTSVEILKAGLSTNTTFLVDQNDLASKGSVVGHTSGTDTLTIVGSSFDLRSTTLTSVEKLVADSTLGTAASTTFFLDQADLATNGSIIGTTMSADKLVANGNLDLISTTLADIEILEAGKNSATTFTVDDTDLSGLTAITGSSGADTLAVKGGTADLSGIDLTSIETVKSTQTTSTSFTIQGNDLKANGGAVAAIAGSTAGTDSLTLAGSSFDLRSTTLTSIEQLVADTVNTTFTLDQADIAKNGSITGSTNAGDKLIINGASLDLTSAALNDVELLAAGKSTATTFILDSADLNDVTAVSGSSGADTLTVKGDLDFGTRNLDNIETLKAGLSTATAFIVQDVDLKANGGAIATITGSSGTDSLTVVGTNFNLSSTAVTNVEQLIAGDDDTTFTFDQADIAKNGSITGSTDSADAVIINGVSLDLTSTVMTGVETIEAGTSKATTFTVDAADLADVTAVNGSTGGTDSLIVKTGSTVDLGNTVLTSVEIVKTLATGGVSFTLQEADLAGQGGSVAQVIGAGGIDSLTVKGTAFDLRNTTLTSVESLIGDSAATAGVVFRVDQADLAKNGSIIGTTNSDDEVVANGTSLDLTSTTLTNVENLSGGSNTVFTISGTQLGDLDSIESGSGGGTLIVKDTAIDVSNLSTLDAIDTLKAGLAGATTFTVDEGQLGFNGGDTVHAIVGSSGSDILQIVGTDFNLSDTTLTSVEQLVATDNGSNGTVFTLDQADLAKGGSITGSTSANDEILANGTALDLTSTTVSGVEHLKADAGGTTFTLTGSQFVAFDDIEGDGNDDTLVLKTTDFNLALGASISSIEELKAGVAGATTFIVAKSDLVSGGGDVETITGSSGADTLTVKGSDFNLTGVTLSSIDKLVAETGVGAVTFTLENTLLSTKTTIVGTTNATDTIVAANTVLDLRSTTLSSVEELKAGTTFGTTFTITSAQLGGLKISGSTGADTLQISSNNYDLSSTSLSSIEILAGSVASTTFKLNQADLAANGSVTGLTTGTDTIIAVDTQLDLSSTTLTSIEKLQAGNSGDTTFTVNQNDLAAKGSVVGGKGFDSLVTADAGIDLTNTTLTSIEKLVAGTTNDTSFLVDQADLAKGGSVIGSSGDDTLIVAGTTVDLTSTTLTSVEALESNGSKAATFTLDAADLAGLQSITGSTAAGDTLIVKNTTIDLSGITVSGIEALKAGGTADTTIILQGNGGFSSITGTSKTDTLETSTTALNLTSTTLSSIEILKAGNTGATTFTVDQADLASKGSVEGNGGTDTLVTGGSSLNLTSTSLTSVEKLVTTNATATTFTLDSADLGVLQSITGSSGSDTLIVTDAAFDLSSTAVTFVGTLKAGSAKNTTFTVNQADLASGGSVIGSSGTDTLQSADATLNLLSTSLTSVEVLAAAAGGTAFTVDQSDLANKGSVIGSTSATDTLIIDGTSFDVTSSTLTSVDVLKAGSASATTFRVDQEDLAANGSVVGSTGTDTLIANGTALNLASTNLTSVEILQAGTSKGTTFTVDQGDLANGGSVNGSSSAIDKLISANTAIDLTSTTLTSVEVIATAATGSNGTTFTVDASDLASGGSVIGSTNAADDKLVVKDSTINLTSTTLTSIEVLKAGVTSNTTFTVDKADLAANGSVMGSTGTDMLVINGSDLNLTSTTLTSVEILTTAATGSVGTTFTVDQSDLASGGSVNGNTNAVDTLAAGGTGLDLTSTTLTSIEKLVANSSSGTTFAVDAADLAAGGSVVGHTSGTDTLTVKDSSIDLTSTTLTSIEVLKAGNTAATTFTVDLNDVKGATFEGVAGKNDTLIVNDTNFDLSSTQLTSVEILKAGSTDATTFKVDQSDLAGGGSVEGVSGKDDSLVAAGTELDLSSTTLASVEILKSSVTTTAGTNFTVDMADLAAGGSIIGNTSSLFDQLFVTDSTIDLTSTTLTSIEQLKAASTDATTFTVDQDDLAAGGGVTGTTNTTDALVINGALLDLTSTTLNSIESLEAGTASSTTFKVDQLDLSGVTAVKGSTGTDTLAVSGTALDLTSATLTSVEILSTLLTGSLGTTFTVDKADLASGGSVLGNSNSSAIDTLVSSSTDFDLSSTTLTSVEVLKAGNSGGTTFKVDQADLVGGGSVIGHTGGTDTLLVTGTSLDLSSTSLTSVEILKAGLSTGTTFTVDQADLAAGGSVVGHTSGTDTLFTHGSMLDLTSTTLTSIEVLKSDYSGGTEFKVDLSDIATGATVTGSTGIDTLTVNGTDIDLTSTTLSSIEHLTANTTGATTFTLNQADLNAMGSAGLISGHSTVTDTLVVDATDIYLASTTLSSIEIIETSNQTVATHFTVSNGQAGATIELTANTVDDTITLESGYKLGADGIADSAAVLAHTVAINHFEAGASSDVLDLGSITSGTVTRNDITGYINLVNPATLKDALDLAAASSTAGSNSSVVSFVYQGDTYVVVDHSNDTKLSADDSVIKLVGVTTTLDASNIDF